MRHVSNSHFYIDIDRWVQEKNKCMGLLRYLKLRKNVSKDLNAVFDRTVDASKKLCGISKWPKYS